VEAGRILLTMVSWRVGLRETPSIIEGKIKSGKFANGS
jgi:hypothetical protein